MVETVKKEMSLLSEVDKPGSNFDSYVDSLESQLNQKISMI